MSIRPTAVLGAASLALALSMAPLATAAADATPRIPAAPSPALHRSLVKDAASVADIGPDGCASLHKGALAAYFDDHGAHFAGDTPLSLRLTAWGRGAQLQTIGTVAPTIDGKRVSYAHGALTEWWRVLPEGFEQSFTVTRQPAGSGKLIFMLSATRGARERGNTLVFGHLRYGDMVVTDARGKIVPSTLTAKGDRILIAVNDANARYPLTVDPLVRVEQEVTSNDGGTYYLLGSPVVLAGNVALVGAPYATVNGNLYQGAVYVFTKTNGVWTQTQKLSAGDSGASDNFGTAIAVSGGTAIIGAPNATVNGNYGQGAAYVFTESSGVWSQAQELVASDGAAGNMMGYSVAIDGTTALVGDPTEWVNGNDSQGAVYVFTENGNTWSQAQKLIASDGAQDDTFGGSIALDGNTALISSSLAAIDGNADQGAVYVFTDSGDVWNQTQKFTSSDGESGDLFGNSLALSGTEALVGAFAATVNGNPDEGAAYVFVDSGGTWSQTQKLIASDGAQNHSFGSAVALDGSTALIGAPIVTVNGNYQQGEVYEFTNTNGNWLEKQKLMPSDGNEVYDFGEAIALDDRTVIIGAPASTVDNNYDQGVVFLYDAYDLDLSVNAPGRISRNAEYTSEIVATNSSSLTAPAVAVTADVPSGTSFVSASSSQGDCSQNSGIVSCNFGAIAGDGGTASADITLQDGNDSIYTIENTTSVTKTTPALTSGSTTIVEAPPVAEDGDVTVTENKTASGTLNASDANGDPLTFSIVNNSLHGTVKLTDANKGGFTYTPVSGYTGSDSFTFKANDGYADSNTAKISVTVKASGGGSGGGGGGLGWPTLLALLGLAMTGVGSKRRG